MASGTALAPADAGKAEPAADKPAGDGLAELDGGVDGVLGAVGDGPVWPNHAVDEDGVERAVVDDEAEPVAGDEKADAAVPVVDKAGLGGGVEGLG